MSVSGVVELGLGAEVDDSAAVAFGGAIGGRGFEECGHGLALGGGFLAGFAAGLGFAVKRLRHRSGAADIAEREHFDLEDAAVVGYGEHVAFTYLSCGLGILPVELNASEVTGSRGEGTGFEKAGGPKPLVDSYGRHASILLQGDALRRRCSHV